MTEGETHKIIKKILDDGLSSLEWTVQQEKKVGNEIRDIVAIKGDKRLEIEIDVNKPIIRVNIKGRVDEKESTEKLSEYFPQSPLPGTIMFIYENDVERSWVGITETTPEVARKCLADGIYMI